MVFPQYYSALPGSFLVSGGPVTVHATFTQTRQVALTEHGLPGGMTWWANFTGPYSFMSSAPTMVFYLPAGTWTFTVHAENHDYTAAGHRFVIHRPLAAPHSAVTFSERFVLHTFRVTFTESGLPGGSTWCVVIPGGPTACGHGTSVHVTEPNGTYNYTLTTTAGGFSASGGVVHVHGATNVAVVFSDPPAVPSRLAPAVAGETRPANAGTPASLGLALGVGLAIASLGALLLALRRAQR